MRRAAERAATGDEEAAHQKIETSTVEEQDEEERHSLLSIIANWLLSAPQWSALGAMLAGEEKASSRHQLVRDSFAERSTGNLKLRVTALKIYGKWKGKVLPISENGVYDYLSHLRESGAPPTRGKSLVEAACPLAAVAGSPDLALIAQSSRVRGAAFNLLSTKTYRKQKSPLTLNQVAALESLMIAK
eukprot:920771-Amphidinium_carterae.1